MYWQKAREPHAIHIFFCKKCGLGFYRPEQGLGKTRSALYICQKIPLMDTASTSQPPKTKRSGQLVSFKRKIPLDRFLLRYASREDPYKYEWNRGTIEKTPRTMNRDQFILLQRLMRLFTQTQAYAAMGELFSEVDMLMETHERTRRADIAYMPGEQVERSRNGEPTVCPFVIEVISKNDQANAIGQKLIEYFEHGVVVVWVVFPSVKKVEVYRSLRDVTMCYGDDVCSASPVLPDFSISVADLLA